MIEISNRYFILSGTQKNLNDKKQLLDKMLEEKKAEVTSFERGMESKVMSIGNEIASLTIECDKVDALKSALVNDDEETSAKK